MVVHGCNPVLGRLKQEDCELETNLAYVVRPCLKKQKQTNKKGSKKN
jgi:hypothetical protein